MDLLSSPPPPLHCVVYIGHCGAAWAALGREGGESQDRASSCRDTVSGGKREREMCVARGEKRQEPSHVA